MHDEEALSGGNASGRVVRIGATVRKPADRSSASVDAYVDALRSDGVDAPAPLGLDELGRRVLEFVPGPLASQAPLDREGLRRVGGMIRAIHDASARYGLPAGATWSTAIPAPAAELICHNDLAPWNLVVGERWVFIDWDAAAPSTRLWDLAYAAQAFALNDPARVPRDAGDDLAAIVDGYGADDRLRVSLPEAMLRRTEAMLRLLRTSQAASREPWASMHDEGHGEHWSAAAAYVAAHRTTWAVALQRRGA